MRGEGIEGESTHVLVAGTGDSVATPAVTDECSVLGVTYETDAETWLGRWAGDVERAAVVSVGERSRSAASTSASGRPLTAVTGIVETVPDETDVGTVGSLVHDYLSAWADDGETTVFVDDLAAVIDRTSTETAFRFVHAVLSCADATGARVVVTLDPDAYPPHVVGTFAELFDDVRR
ncbi:DUF7504 family protein [Halobacterium wangiae]|uniref:DUF7504 family protein n=1 Tax=Halobacterium wangiae TaxID=2902623 RepID=UPI001E5947CF|nr:hypothetical protein [Halobacterium wangiae]